MYRIQNLILVSAILLMGACSNKASHVHHDLILGKYFHDFFMPTYNKSYLEIATYRSAVNSQKKHSDKSVKGIINHNDPRVRYRNMYLKLLQDKMANNAKSHSNKDMSKYLDKGLDPKLKDFHNNRDYRNKMMRDTEVKNDTQKDKVLNSESNNRS